MTPACYAFGHFSQYIVPNATRIQVSGSSDAVAFQNPDGSIVAEVYNNGTSPRTTTLGAGSALYQFDVPPHGRATLRTMP